MKRLPVLFMMLSVFILLVSCSNRSEDQSPIYQFTYEEQNFEIISLYENVLQYTSHMIDDPSLDTKKEYYEKVIIPFYELAKEKNLDVEGFRAFFSPTLIEQQLKDNTLELLENQEKINAYIEESIINSAERISGGDKTIFVMPFNPDNTSIIRDMEGASGVALSDSVILLLIDPSFSEMALKYVTAHEYNHTIAMESLGVLDYSLLNSIILEGKADSFGGIVYADHAVPWLEPSLTVDEERIVYDEIRELLDGPNYIAHGDLFYGNYNKGIPRWSNYKLGYNIMQSFLENNPDLSIEEWTRLGANEILQGSDYRDF